MTLKKKRILLQNSKHSLYHINTYKEASTSKTNGIVETLSLFLPLSTAKSSGHYISNKDKKTERRREEGRLARDLET